MIRKVMLGLGITALALVIIGAAYLMTRPDPGPFLVALRSDTPDQVERALNAILSGDTVIQYDGASYSPVSTEDLDRLGLRYFHKATGQTNEPLKGDTAAWMGFANRVALKVRSRTQN